MIRALTKMGSEKKLKGKKEQFIRKGGREEGRCGKNKRKNPSYLQKYRGLSLEEIMAI